MIINIQHDISCVPRNNNKLKCSNLTSQLFLTKYKPINSYDPDSVDEMLPALHTD